MYITGDYIYNVIVIIIIIIIFYYLLLPYIYPIIHVLCNIMAVTYTGEVYITHKVIYLHWRSFTCLVHWIQLVSSVEESTQGRLIDIKARAKGLYRICLSASSYSINSYIHPYVPL